VIQGICGHRQVWKEPLKVEAPTRKRTSKSPHLDVTAPPPWRKMIALTRNERKEERRMKTFRGEGKKECRQKSPGFGIGETCRARQISEMPPKKGRRKEEPHPLVFLQKHEHRGIRVRKMNHYRTCPKWGLIKVAIGSYKEMKRKGPHKKKGDLWATKFQPRGRQREKDFQSHKCGTWRDRVDQLRTAE